MCDGPDATGAFVLGGRGGVLQVEPFEAQYPVLIEHVRARIDSGGPGEHRGGLGIDTAIRLLSDAELVVRGDRMVLAPTGRQGGESGARGIGDRSIPMDRSTNSPIANRTSDWLATTCS